jgi:hypothetical protein
MDRLFRPRRMLLLLLSFLFLVGGFGFFLFWSPASKQVGLRFLAYTNNGYARIALFEITNHSEHAATWTLRAKGRPLDYRVAVTELIETNGEMRHVGSGGPLTLFGHDSLQFGTDELESTEKKVWVSLRPHPMTETALLRERWSGWLYRLGWHSGAYRLKLGARVDGPTLP